MLGVRRGLPTNRAVVGGLLVAVALVGTWWAAAGGADTPSTRYVVAAHDLAPGQRLGPGDLELVAMDLPNGVARHALTSPDGLGRVVTTGPVDAGELVQTSHLARSTGSRTTRELSLVVEADWAVGGSLRPGDRVDVLVTYGDGVNSSTDVVLSSTTVRRITSARDGGLGGTRSQTITVAVADPEQVKAVTNAARAGQVTITRSTGVADAAASGTYRPPSGSGASSGEDSDAGQAPPKTDGATTSTTSRARGSAASSGG